MTTLYSLIAATAAQSLGLALRVAHLESPSFPVDGRDHSDEAPTAQVIPLTQGYRQDHRPDRNQVMRELSIEPQGGLPVRMKLLSGNSREVQDFGAVLHAPLEHLPRTYGLTYVVADRAL